MAISQAQLAQRDLLRDLLPVRAFSSEPGDRLYLMQDGSISFGFLCQPLTGADTGAKDRLNVLLTQDWPPNTIMQVGLWAGPDIAQYTKWMLDIRDLPPKNRKPTAPESTILSRADFLGKKISEPLLESTGTRVRNIQSFVTVIIPGDGESYPRENDMQIARDLRKSVQQSLKTAGMAPETLSPKRYIRLMQTLINANGEGDWREEVEAKWDQDEEIRDQVFDFDNELEIKRDGLVFGNPDDPEGRCQVSMMSIKRFPDYIDFGMALSYLSDPFRGARGIRENVLFTGSIVFGDPEKDTRSLEIKRQWATQQGDGPMTKFNPKLAEKKEAFDSLFSALNEGDRPVKLYLGVALFSHPDHVQESVSNARTYFREAGFTLMRDRFITLPLFLTCLPFCADYKAVKPLMRYKTMATRHAISLLPLFGDWKGNGRPMLNFTSRNGQLMNYDLFYEGGGNYNALVAAQSGSGKSVLMNEIISSYLSSGGRAWVIDVGYSYKKLCHQYDGQFIQFSDDSNIVLNPFSIVQDINDEIEVLSGIIQSMAAPQDGFTDFQRSQVQKAIKDLWDVKAQQVTIDDLEKELLGHEDQRVNDIGHQLYAYTSKGSYGHYFAGDNNVSFDNSLVVLELEELKSRKQLQQVVLFILIYQIQQGMFLSGTDQEKLLMVDEGWSLLTEGDTGKFMENSYRRVRKNRGSAIIATQGLQDLDTSTGGRAIKENSASTMLLGMKAETVQTLKEEKILDLTDFGFNVLKTVHTEPGLYSEVFIKTAVGSGIGRLMLEPFKQLLYSTKPADLAEIEVFQKQGMNIDEAIYAVIDQRKKNIND